MKWLRETGNESGEWCLTDLRRDYRVCSFNHKHHGGLHIHAPIDGKAIPIPPMKQAKVRAIVTAYAKQHQDFDLETFLEMLK